MSDELDLKVKYKGVGKSKVVTLSEILDIYEDELTEHFAEQASLFGYFSVQLAEADRLVGIAKMKAEQKYARTDAHYRKTYNELEQKFTEAVIRGDVILDEDYQNSLDKQHQAEYNVSIIKSIVNALRMKADMLISMGAHLRQEYSMTGMNVREADMDKAVDEVKKTIKRKKKGEQV